ncbi:MAG: DUF3179 domain-containing protein [Flavobacteriales bacterium]|jgi:hypothetical protein|nr:DUF3179 domain-containing protein [Flavobacteriales bacterium]NCG30403.1 DUF3179 domain-containing protein [Bacteroidota bacterium]MBT3964524.1 DUF3179 domain-containing protein [Flavobacteriales bacterium]MBT4705772.1 DUF3179 domain-containing protein [Flavobacteriales bacterium]MBT4930231.1 DUF3179 domain-containing protein [Flavobacteriales bacterium]
MSLGFNSSLIALIVVFLAASCEKSEPIILDGHLNSVDATVTDDESTEDLGCDTAHLDDNFIFYNQGEAFLTGGPADSQHFDISNWDLNPCNLRFGFCREHFPTVYDPTYETREGGDFAYDADDRFILVEDGDVKAYSIELLVKHEAVNDTTNGHPILVAYCVLADLPIVYSRNYCGNTHTFALSGYTYHDKRYHWDTEAFVMWDRETESLWFPLAEKSVSGTMDEVQLETFNQSKWRVTTYADIQQNYPTAKLLARDIVVDPPEGWPTIDPADVNCN